MRVEIAFQVETGPRGAIDLPFETPAIPAEEQRGEIIRELTLVMAAENDFAYIITCEDPAVAWNVRDADGAGDETGFSPSPNQEEADRRREASTDRRAIPETLGEAMLASATDDRTTVRQKAIIVLIPRLPDRITLLP